MLEYHWRQMRGQATTIIEYKREMLKRDDTDRRATSDDQSRRESGFLECGKRRAKRRVGLWARGILPTGTRRGFARWQNVELVAVCDQALARAQALAGKFGVAQAYGSLEAMLAAEKLDAVHVLLPPDRHFAAARTALEAGVNVFLEKPMCDRAADCEALVRLAAERGVRLGVGHNFLFSEPYEQLRRDLRSGVLGRIDDVMITWHRLCRRRCMGRSIPGCCAIRAIF